VVQLELFKILAKEYEVLKIEAAKERRFIEILSPSYVAEVKDQPKRAFICIGITLLASFFGFVLVLLWGVYDFSCANSREEEVTN